jgi:hypothetical protein
VPADETTIMTEIYTHGPVTAGFNVYSDWIHYPVGTGADQIYRPQGGTEMGGACREDRGVGVKQRYEEKVLVDREFVWGEMGVGWVF